MNQLMLVRNGYPDPPEMDVAVSHALLDEVANNGEVGYFRIHTPADVLAFGRADTHLPGYPTAIRVARAHHFSPIERLAGGHAAVFHDSTLAFSLALPVADSKVGIHERFSLVADIMMKAFVKLGLDAEVGEVPGEYCPGAYSVNLAGRFKVMGVGQRLVKGAAHVGGVVVVDHADRIRDVLIPVYRALGLDWDPRTAGALADRAPGVTLKDVRKAITKQLAKHFDLESAEMPTAIEANAHSLMQAHLPKVA